MNIELNSLMPALRGQGSRSDGLIWFNNDTTILPIATMAIARWVEKYGLEPWFIRSLVCTTTTTLTFSLGNGRLYDRYGAVILPDKCLVAFIAAIGFTAPVPVKGWLPYQPYSNALSLSVVPLGAILEEMNAARSVNQTSVYTSNVLFISNK